MDEFQQEPIHVVREDEIRAQRSNASTWLAAGIVVLVIALGLTVGYIYQQQNVAKTLAARATAMDATVGDLQNQVDTMKTKLDQGPAALPAPVVTQEDLNAAKASANRRAAADTKRFSAMQSTIDDQTKALNDTQNQMSQTRTDLEAGIDSTRNDLNGSIARTHDELVSLEQKGERSYFEFDITKAKHFQKEGPLMVSLRKADPKHEKYDLAMVVNDNQLSKKSVNVYEPVWINGTGHAQVQLVVNKIDKDHIHGYVNAPKYAESASMKTVSDRTGTAMGGENRNPGDESINAAGKDVQAANDPTGTPEAPKSQPQQEQ